MKTIAWLTISIVAVLAYPNSLPKYQQEVIQQPGNEGNDQIHFQSTIRDVLLANEIIPQVLDDFEPTYYIDLAYPKRNERVLLGNDIPVKSVSKRPVFTFHPISGPPSYGDLPNDKNLTFTLILTDPDALSRQNPVKSEMCHWIVTNLTSTTGEIGAEWLIKDREGDVETGSFGDEDLEETLAKGPKPKEGEIESYYPPAPPKKTGPHRYVFVLLEGDTSNLTPPKERPHWGYGKERHGIRDWSVENNLTVVGVNFFFAQHKKQ